MMTACRHEILACINDDISQHDHFLCCFIFLNTFAPLRNELHISFFYSPSCPLAA